MTEAEQVQSGNGAEPEQVRVFWGVLMERTLNCHAVSRLLDISFIAGVKRYERIDLPYMRTDMARNRMAQSFMEETTNPNDVLIMLDGDHVHPFDIVPRLANHEPELGVVGALYFRRGEPFDPLFFKRIDGRLRNPAEWERGMIYECDAVGTGAIAIRRWVFEKLTKQGMGYPWFQYTYPDDKEFNMTEDIFFAGLCEKAGISHFCNTSIITPHLGVRFIDEQDWTAYQAAHPDVVVEQGG